MRMLRRSARNCLMLLSPGCLWLPGFCLFERVWRGSRLMKIPQECCSTLGVLLKTNRFISPLILARGLEREYLKCVMKILLQRHIVPT